MKIVLLPGMDGGGRMLSSFCECLPAWIDPEIVAYPSNLALDYRALERLVRARWARSPEPRSPEPTTLVAESFSGPIAIRLAADPPPGLEAFVLVGTFAVAPLPGWLRRFVVPQLFRVPPPSAALRHFLLGHTASNELVAAAREAIRTPSPKVMALRAREVLEVDVRAELRRIELPLLCIEGRGDRVLPRRGALAKERPGARFELVDAPHFVLQTAPHECAALVVDFLAALGHAPARTETAA